ncbi:2OG-Fe dioxygenase family protein [Mycobacterium sp. HUMS_1102779]|uniref:2OG-Fe dioxygenase family protein n=1 Tax=Mycobacterium sp. HUMS_1102779 TaxID=3383487 RepID=UPI003899EBED
MAPIVCDERTDADPVAAAVRSLTTSGAFVMPCGDVTRNLRAGPQVWARFGRHWEDLAPDPYAEALGVRRLRRYGQFLLHDGSVHRMPDRTFAQPDDSNPLYVGQDRDFAPLTDAFARDPLLHRLIKLLGRVATVLDDVAEWNVKVHPFRVRSAAGGDGLPTPEGIHRDGVTLVSALFVGRRNAVGGESTVCDDAGRPLLTATLTEPGELLLGDDRRTLHGVSPIRPLDPRAPAQRDVLVVTLASRWP